MSLRLCLRCAAVRGESTSCSACGETLKPPNRRNLELTLESRVRVAIDRWEREGFIDGSLASVLRGHVAEVPAEPAPRAARSTRKRTKPRPETPKPPPPSSPPSQAAAPLAAAVVPSAVARASGAPTSVPPAPGAAAPTGDAHGAADDAPEGVHAAREVLGAHGPFPTLERGVSGLADWTDDERAGDPGPSSGSPSELSEYVWWFIGTLLVLAGSVMGVREAWRSVSGPLRQVVIAAAFFCYHGLFLGLSWVVARRSAFAGKVLASLSMGLLPIVFAALAALVASDGPLGVGSSVGVSALTALTLLAAGRRFAGAPSWTMVVALLPPLVAELPLGGATSDLARVGLPFVGLASLAVAGARAARAGPTRVAPLVAALYGALCVGAMSLFGAPGDTPITFGPGTLPVAGCALWVALAGSILAESVGTPAWADERPRLTAVVELLSLACVAAAGCIGAASAFARDPSDDPFVTTTFVGVAGLAGASFFLTQRRHAGALHPAVLLAFAAVALFARARFVGEPTSLWATASLFPSLLLVASGSLERGRRRVLAAWGTLLGAGSVALAAASEASLGGPPLRTTAMAAAGLSLAAHVGGGLRGSRLHYVGAAAAAAGACAAWLPGVGATMPLRSAQLLGAVGVAYGALALGHGALVSRRAPDDPRRPFDDASLGLLIAGAFLAARSWPVPAMSATALRMTTSSATAMSLAAATIAAFAGALLVRAVRDRSKLVPLVATWLFADAALAATGAVDVGPQARVLAWATLAASIVAILRGRAEETPSQGRFAFVAFLPLGARGRSLLDGIALGAVLVGLRAAFAIVTWMGARAEEHRPLVVGAGVILIVATLVAFATRSHGVLRARGSVGTLIVALVAIALAAVANRIGRPLPPAVVGVRLSGVVLVVWLAARGLVRVGPALGRALERPDEGPRYHYVAHAGVAALGALLAVDAVLVGAPTLVRALVVTPPSLLFGAALAAFLLHRSFHHPAFLHGALFLALAGAPLVATQSTLTGPALAPLDPPGGRWVPIETFEASRGDWLDPARFVPAGANVVDLGGRAWLGLAAYGLVVALVAIAVLRVRGKGSAIGEPLVFWASVPAVSLLGGAWVQASAPGAGLALLTGLALLAAGARRATLVVLSASLTVGLHAYGQASARVPIGAGALFAALGLGVVLLGPYATTKWQAPRDRTRALFQGVALAEGALGLVYALAAGGPTEPLAAGPRLLQDASFGLQGAWASTPAVGGTLLLLALATGIAGAAWSSPVSSMLVGVAGAVLAMASTAIVTTGLVAQSTSLGQTVDLGDVFARWGTAQALGIALAATALHGSARALAPSRGDLARGARVTRDVLSVLVFVAIGVHLRWALPSGHAWLGCGVGALAVAGLVGMDALVREKTPRHVYVVEATAVGIYALVREIADLSALADALATLVYGFVLVGVGVVAERKRLPPVAAATRRFVAALPVGIALLQGPSTLGAWSLLATAASLLYGGLAALDRSRVFGSLAALAANAALLFGALSVGFDDVETYVAPVGLLLVMLTQIFGARWTPPARQATRVLGSLLLLAPPAAKLCFQLGRAADGTYAVVFGAVCLLGVTLGMVLRIRAYLAMGTLFLTLDVIANLVYAGLRNHRVGFVLLSAAGLAVIGAMVTSTLAGPRLRAAWARARRALSRWE